MRIIASVQARLGSTRLPGKVLYQLGDRRILQWAIDRASISNLIDQTVAAVGDEPENDAITEFCQRTNIEYVVGPEEDLLARHLGVANKSEADVLVRITADCPFIPQNEINRVINEHLSNDARYTTNFTEQMPIGTAVDVIDTDLLNELKSKGETHPVKLARSDPEEWGTMWTPNSDWYAFSEAHIAVDTPTDYWNLVDALEAVGDDPQQIARWLIE